MQRVVRLSLAGLLAFAGAGLTACGDKVTLPPPAAFHTVTVSPPAASVAVGGTTQLAASVNAGPGATNRTVQWTSSDATTASVDQTGKVTGVKGGSVTIIAKWVVDPTISGVASITVTGSGFPTATISSIVQTSGGTSSAADLSNAKGQLDITLNVDPNGQIIKTVTATITCGTKTKSASQTISDVAPSGVNASAVPITLSINTAAFNATTGVPDLNNGACGLSAVVTTGTGRETATNSTPLTLNNTDVVIVKTTNSGNSAADVNGAFWKSGNVTVAATPVLYSGTTIASAAITLPGATTPTQTGVPLTAGVASATWSATATIGASVKDVTLGTSAAPINPTVSFVDSQGNVLTPAQANAVSESNIRVDNQAPPILTVSQGTPPAAADVMFTQGTQNTAAGWVGKAFTFTKAITLSAAVKADNNGVDRVTFTTQWAPTTTSTWTTFSDVNTIAETSTSTALDLRVVVCDALANCTNSGVLTQLGVDLTAPTATTGTNLGPQANEVVGIGGTLTNGGNVSVAASDPQGVNGANGSGFGANPVLVSETKLAPTNPVATTTGQVQTCVIGTPTAPADGTCSAPLAQPLTFPIQTAAPGQYALMYTVTDQAGNTAPAVATSYYIDQAAATMSGGISIPASIAADSTFSSSGVDDMDFSAANAFLRYPTAPGTGNIVLPATSTAAGVAFDNTLARSSTVTTKLPKNQFYRSLAVNNGGVGTPLPNAKPDLIGIRGLDAANNLSAPNTASLPPANISAAGEFIIGRDLDQFTITSDVPSVHNGTPTTTTPRSATFTATVTAIDATAGSPFNSVCFYLQSPDGAQNGQAGAVTKAAIGDLVLLGCSSSFTTTQVGTPSVKQISTTLTFDPDPAFGTTGSLTVFAIGSNANADALLARNPVALGLVP